MFQRVKGTEDFYPEDKLLQNYIFSVLKETAMRFGFSEVEVPVVESIDLLTAKSGEEIKEQIFVFKKKGDEDLGLRFDLTVPIVRMFVSKQKELQKPVKWFSIDKAWRYENPQKGRQREFYQLSVELIGSSKQEADVEILSLLISCLSALGLKKEDFVIKLNNRKLFYGLLLDIVSKEKLPSVAKIVDKISKISEQEFHRNLLNLGLNQIQIEKIEHVFLFNGIPSEVLNKLEKHTDLNDLAKEGFNEIKKIISFISEDYFILDLSIVRGFDYYTGFVFECCDKKGKFRAVAGGGRYDNLIQTLGGDSCPATGFGLGYSTLLLLLEDKNLIKIVENQIDYYIAPIDETVIKQAIQIVHKLRKRSSVDIDLSGRKLSKQLEYAVKINAKKVIIIGKKDLENNEVTVRELDTGKEQKVKLKDISNM